MRVLPILFNTDMVRAILDGRKTVTRRVVKPQPTNDIQCALGYCVDGDKKEIGKFAFGSHESGGKMIFCKPPYRPGDILYVRETWRVGAWDVINHTIAFDYIDGTCGKLTYMHDRELFDRLVNQSREDARKARCVYNGADFVWNKGESPCRWHPSIHMPKEAARIFLKVKDVRVERLQEMRSEDALKEGIKVSEFDLPNCGVVTRFKHLWNSTIKKSDLSLYGFDANPWVWVIEFERCEKPENF